MKSVHQNRSPQLYEKCPDYEKVFNKDLFDILLSKLNRSNIDGNLIICLICLLDVKKHKVKWFFTEVSAVPASLSNFYK